MSHSTDSLESIRVESPWELHVNCGMELIIRKVLFHEAIGCGLRTWSLAGNWLENKKKTSSIFNENLLSKTKKPDYFKNNIITQGKKSASLNSKKIKDLI